MKDPISLQTGAIPEPHEIETATLLARKGKAVRFLAPVRAKGSKTPDIEMDGLKWEIKCPKGKSSRTIENNLRIALKQSENIIIDLRRCKIIDSKAVSEVRSKIKMLKKIKRILVIAKEEKILDFIK